LTLDDLCRLLFVAVASVIDRLEPDHVTVAVDGSLYRFHPHFKDLMQNKISQLIEPNRKVGSTILSITYVNQSQRR